MKQLPAKHRHRYTRQEMKAATCIIQRLEYLKEDLLRMVEEEANQFYYT